MTRSNNHNPTRRISRSAAAIFFLAAIIPFLLSCSGKEPGQNVLFITIDTLRADHLGCYGYERDTSPSIDAFADGAIVFENCISQATSTLPSHASIFTALYPPAHGVINNLLGLSDSVPSLVNVFKDYGYTTGAIVSNVVLESRFGLDQGFSTYDEEMNSRELNRRKFRERRADSATDAAIAWLRKNEGESFFLWVHYVDPHGAYFPPPEYRKMFVGDEWFSEGEEVRVAEENFVPHTIPKYQELSDIGNPSYYISQYDGEIRFTDDHVGRLLDFIEKSGLSPDTIVVLTADHGESFTERDLYFTHTFRTYDEQARIPLIMKFPGEGAGAAARIKSQVRAIDIFPTLLEKTGLENPHPVHGRSLAKLMSAAGKGHAKEILTEKARSIADTAIIYSDYGIEALEKKMGAQKSIRAGRWKLTLNSRDGSVELYDLEHDRFERDNLAQARPELVRQMGKLLHLQESEITTAVGNKPKLSPELIEQLDSFGYLAK